MSTNANLSISPTVLRMLGRKLYTNHPLIICTRELLQNSIDACKRKGVNPKIKIEINEYCDNDLNEHIILTCEDNGEGMSKDVLLNKFLCLGESGKRDGNGGTGGFGIAKAAIMSNDFWEVTTHNLYVSTDTLGMPPQKPQKRLNGTRVMVRISEGFNSSTIKDALNMVYLSEVKIHLRYTVNNELVFDDPSAGRIGKAIKDRYDKQNPNRFDVSLLPEFDNGHYEFKGISAFCLNGLVQFVKTSRNRKSNAIVNLYTDKLPTDKEYPLSMSRENIESSIYWMIQDILSEYDENPLSTNIAIGRANSEDTRKISVNNGVTIKGNVKNPALEYTSRQDNDLSSIRNVDNLPAIGKLQYLTEYCENPPTTEEKRIIRLWAAILLLTADIGDTFGIGITGQDNTEACRMWHDGKDYYLLNVRMIMDDNFSMDGLIHRLHMLACHEITHLTLSSHNEIFTSRMDNYYTLSIEKILANMPKLRAIVRNNYK